MRPQRTKRHLRFPFDLLRKEVEKSSVLCDKCNSNATSRSADLTLMSITRYDAVASRKGRREGRPQYRYFDAGRSIHHQGKTDMAVKYTNHPSIILKHSRLPTLAPY